MSTSDSDTSFMSCEDDFDSNEMDFDSCYDSEEMQLMDVSDDEMPSTPTDEQLIEAFNQQLEQQHANTDYIDGNLSFADASSQRQHQLIFMKELERKYHIYAPHAKYLKFRRVIVDWMCEVGVEFQLAPTTIHMSIAYFDRILSQVEVSKNRLQLVSICCILVAAKHEEQERMVPQIARLNECSENAYDLSTIKDMEAMVLATLGWRLCEVVPLHLIKHYLCDDIVFPHDTCDGKDSVTRAVHRYVRKYVDFFVDICQQEHEFRQHLPSVVAATIIAVSRRAMKIEPMWNMQLTRMTGYTAKDLYPCFHHLITFYETHYPSNAVQQPKQQSPTNIYEMASQS